MKKEEFKRLLKEHGQVTIGINPFDLGEITAIYQMDEHGDVYEVDEIDQTRGLLFNINDDAALQELENDLLCDVCSYSHNPFEHAVAYIKDHLEHWEIERGWAEIGKAMHHCVEGYYTKTNSLVLSARSDDGKRLETIEIDLRNFRIIQSRGVCNQPSKRHDEIVKLMNENMGKVMALAKPKKKAAKKPARARQAA